jgi:hypothetical protein
MLSEKAEIYKEFADKGIDPPKSAFVVFKSQRIFREILKQTKNTKLANMDLERSEFSKKLIQAAPEPNDVQWANIDVGRG